MDDSCHCTNIPTSFDPIFERFKRNVDMREFDAEKLYLLRISVAAALDTCLDHPWFRAIVFDGESTNNEMNIPPEEKVEIEPPLVNTESFNEMEPGVSEHEVQLSSELKENSIESLKAGVAQALFESQMSTLTCFRTWSQGAKQMSWNQFASGLNELGISATVDELKNLSDVIGVGASDIITHSYLLKYASRCRKD